MMPAPSKDVEAEAWLDRVEVLTPQDHSLYQATATEVIDSLIGNAVDSGSVAKKAVMAEPMATPKKAGLAILGEEESSSPESKSLDQYPSEGLYSHAKFIARSGDEHWSKRLSGLQDFRGNAKVDSETSAEDLKACVEISRDAIARQFGDVRSSIVHESCNIVGQCVKELVVAGKDDCAVSVAEFFIPKLLETMHSAEIPVAEGDARELCVQTCLTPATERPTKALLTAIINGLAGPSEFVRGRCAVYLISFLRDLERQQLEPFEALIYSALWRIEDASLAQNFRDEFRRHFPEGGRERGASVSPAKEQAVPEVVAPEAVEVKIVAQEGAAPATPTDDDARSSAPAAPQSPVKAEEPAMKETQPVADSAPSLEVEVPPTGGLTAQSSPLNLDSGNESPLTSPPHAPAAAVMDESAPASESAPSGDFKYTEEDLQRVRDEVNKQWSQDTALLNAELEESNALLAKEQKAKTALEGVLSEFEETMNKVVEDQQRNVAAEARRISSLEQQNAHLKGESEALVQKFQELLKKYEGKKEDLAAAETREATLRNALQNAEENVEKQKAAYAKLRSHAEQKLKDAENAVNKTQATAEDRDSQVRELKSQQIKLEDALSTKDSEVAKVKAELAGAEAKCSSLQEKVGSREKDLEKLYSQVSDLEGEVRGMRQQISEYKASNESLAASIKQHKEEIAQHKRTIEDLYEVKNSNVNLQSQIQQYKDEHQTLKARIYDAHETEQQLKMRLAAAAGGAGGDSKEAQELAAKIKALEAELTDVKAECLRKADENKELNSICTELLEQLEAAKGSSQ